MRHLGNICHNYLARNIFSHRKSKLGGKFIKLLRFKQIAQCNRSTLLVGYLDSNGRLAGDRRFYSDIHGCQIQFDIIRKSHNFRHFHSLFRLQLIPGHTWSLADIRNRNSYSKSSKCLLKVHRRLLQFTCGVTSGRFPLLQQRYGREHIFFRYCPLLAHRIFREFRSFTSFLWGGGNRWLPCRLVPFWKPLQSRTGYDFRVPSFVCCVCGNARGLLQSFPMYPDRRFLHFPRSNSSFLLPDHNLWILVMRNSLRLLPQRHLFTDVFRKNNFMHIITPAGFFRSLQRSIQHHAGYLFLHPQYFLVFLFLRPQSAFLFFSGADPFLFLMPDSCLFPAPLHILTPLLCVFLTTPGAHPPFGGLLHG